MWPEFSVCASRFSPVDQPIRREKRQSQWACRIFGHNTHAYFACIRYDSVDPGSIRSVFVAVSELAENLVPSDR